MARRNAPASRWRRSGCGASSARPRSAVQRAWSRRSTASASACRPCTASQHADSGRRSHWIATANVPLSSATQRQPLTPNGACGTSAHALSATGTGTGTARNCTKNPTAHADRLSCAAATVIVEIADPFRSAFVVQTGAVASRPRTRGRGRDRILAARAVHFDAACNDRLAIAAYDPAAGLQLRTQHLDVVGARVELADHHQQCRRCIASEGHAGLAFVARARSRIRCRLTVRQRRVAKSRQGGVDIAGSPNARLLSETLTACL
jgi:hypothetical protein